MDGQCNYRTSKGDKMTLPINLIQSMLKRNSKEIAELHKDVNDFKGFAKNYKRLKAENLTDYCYSEANKFSKQIKRLVEIQKALKRELKILREYSAFINSMTFKVNNEVRETQIKGE